jgi:transcriptional regulator with XRE-family HTH domain
VERGASRIYGECVAENLALRRVLRRLNLSQEELAHRIREDGRDTAGCNRAMVDRWLRGVTKCPQPRYLRALERVTGLPAASLGYPAGRDHEIEAGADEVALAVREAEAEQLSHLSDPAPETIDALWEQAAEVARAGNRRPDQIFTASRRICCQALRLIGQGRRPGALSDLYVIAGQATALMASTAFDLDRWDASATLARSAVSYARLVGDASLHAWTLGLAALLANWRDEPDIALGHFQRGLQVAPPGIPRARLRYIAARSYALLGDASSVGEILAQARGDQDEARRLRDRLSEETGGEFAFGHARAEACAAAAWLDLGRSQQAKDAARRALKEFTALPPSRRPHSQATGARIDLATGCLLQRELDEATDVLGQVLAAHTPPENVSLSRRLARSRRVLATPKWVGDPAARRLDDAIGDWLADQSAADPPAE